jgi:hypothetical protein
MPTNDSAFPAQARHAHLGALFARLCNERHQDLVVPSFDGTHRNPLLGVALGWRWGYGCARRLVRSYADKGSGDTIVPSPVGRVPSRFAFSVASPAPIAYQFAREGGSSRTEMHYDTVGPGNYVVFAYLCCCDAGAYLLRLEVDGIFSEQSFQVIK